MWCSVHKRPYGKTEERCLTQLWKLGRAQEGGKTFRAETQSKDILSALVDTQSGREENGPCKKREVAQHEVSALLQPRTVCVRPAPLLPTAEGSWSLAPSPILLLVSRTALTWDGKPISCSSTPLQKHQVSPRLGRSQTVGGRVLGPSSDDQAPASFPAPGALSWQIPSTFGLQTCLGMTTLRNRKLNPNWLKH